MFTKHKVAVACMLLLSLLPGCAEENDDAPPTPPPTPDGGQRNDRDPIVIGPYDDEVELEVRNLTSSTIYGLYVSPSADDSWGPNLLRGRSLSPGYSDVFTNKYCNAYYDVRADDLLGRAVARGFRFYLRCGRHEIVELTR